MGAQQSITSEADKSILEPQQAKENGEDNRRKSNEKESFFKDGSEHKLQEEQQLEQDYEVVTTRTTSSPDLSIRQPSIAKRKTQWEPTEEERKNLSINDFEIKGILGIGTYGIVKLALHQATGTSVALKIVSKEQVVSMRQEKHILRERQVHSQLDHPLIAKLICTFQDQDCVYLVMEFLPGGELYSVLYSHPCTNQEEEEEEVLFCTTTPCSMRLDAKSRFCLLRNKGKGLHEPHAAFYLGCILMALEYLHDQNILYRDLKLENLVLDTQGYPQLVDFGFAKKINSNNFTSQTFCGTMSYMAPEIILHQPHDQRADLWSFGVIVYELFFGEIPFYHENPREQGRRIINEPIEWPIDEKEEEKINPMVYDLIQNLLEKNPKKRFSSIEKIKKHAFFQKYFPTCLKWQEIVAKKAKVPFVPVQGQNFDRSFFEVPSASNDDDLYCIEPYLNGGTDDEKLVGVDLFHEF
jgi:serine/threonine protein kinase